jgi:hypothetical protein
MMHWLRWGPAYSAGLVLVAVFIVGPMLGPDPVGDLINLGKNILLLLLALPLVAMLLAWPLSVVYFACRAADSGRQDLAEKIATEIRKREEQ